jgi:hypothetical protein
MKPKTVASCPSPSSGLGLLADRTEEAKPPCIVLPEHLKVEQASWVNRYLKNARLSKNCTSSWFFRKLGFACGIALFIHFNIEIVVIC